MGPLHGVPISLKDQFNVEGFDTTLGYVARAFHPASSNALLVDFLQGLGAIVLAKTNLPQSIMVCGLHPTTLNRYRLTSAVG
jgi:Asp-tRNA(Asn)/Glu-tRNA(Gln) amidotransferase A subunit family amidase